MNAAARSARANRQNDGSHAGSNPARRISELTRAFTTNGTCDRDGRQARRNTKKMKKDDRAKLEEPHCGLCNVPVADWSAHVATREHQRRLNDPLFMKRKIAESQLGIVRRMDFSALPERQGNRKKAKGKNE